MSDAPLHPDDTPAAITGKPHGKHAIAFVCATVCIDAMGIGIIMPVMPDLIRELSGFGLDGAAIWGGYLTFGYAAMQFLFGATVGNLSDRFGRRPVLLVSLAVLTVDYLIMALAPSLLILFLGRVMAGIAAATHSTANAYVADISSKADRAKNFGLIGAAFGVGFIIGPIIGGIAGEFGARAPFYAAAVLAVLNLAYGWFVLPESLAAKDRRAFNWKRANPLGGALQLTKVPSVAWLILSTFLFSVGHWVYPAVWSYHTKEVFGWSSAEVGISLAAVGVGFVVVQGWLIRVILPRFGEAKTVIAGLGFDIVGLTILAFASAGWVAYAAMPLVALGAMVTPAITALMANRVSDGAQGELQGALSSVQGITMLVSPLLMTQLFGYFASDTAFVYFPGAPFLAAATLMGLSAIPFLIGSKR